MPRLYHVPLGLLLACLLAGCYGALHDQLSWTLSPEYFLDNKFIQFAIPAHLHNRLGAAWVGWLATWWMGLFVGVFLVPAALVLPGRQHSFRRATGALLTALGTALLVGGVALAASFVVIGPEIAGARSFPAGVVDKVAYARVGMMHNASYMGGFLGIFAGLVYLLLGALTHSRAASQRYCATSGSL
ncbi:MAG: hypothetical protein HZB16_01810 [Armatimonadetes bacterium]|nr:hypothetical protein [Armatimonadota bacterium]